MAFEDKALTCVQCNQEFVFTAGEQQFFVERELNSPPKRCKSCRQSNKKRHRGGAKGPSEYRSPAFEGSAPAHQKVRGSGRGPARREYRSPTFSGSDTSGAGEYRSPAFAEYNEIRPDEEYRAPGFKEYDQIKPEDEYRAPGFKEYDRKNTDERPLFAIVCVACGQDAMVPFIPEEKEEPMCQECYRAHKLLLRKEAEKEAAQAAAEQAAAAASLPEEPVQSPQPDLEPESVPN
jgi:CxxC-x17-CxxC domain-containing protein